MNIVRYETKPALSVPIHVVELTNVPPELRMSAAIPEQEESSPNIIPAHKVQKKQWVSFYRIHCLIVSHHPEVVEALDAKVICHCFQSYSFGNYEPSCAKFN